MTWCEKLPFCLLGTGPTVVDVGYTIWLAWSREPSGGNENADIADLLLSLSVLLVRGEGDGLVSGHVCALVFAEREERGCYAGERGVDACYLVERAGTPDAE